MVNHIEVIFVELLRGQFLLRQQQKLTTKKQDLGHAGREQSRER
jgi:hypothetical protein